MQYADALPHDVYFRLFDSSPDAILLTRHDGSCAGGNRAAQLLLGYSAEELCRVRCTELVDGSDTRGAALFGGIAGEAAASGAGQLRRKDGGRVEALFSSISFNAANGERLHAVTLRLPGTAKSAQPGLQETRDYHAEIVESLFEGVVVFDGQGVVRACNQSACNLLGLPAESLLGHLAGSKTWPIIRKDGSPFPPQQYPSVVALATGKPVQNVEFGYYRPSGELVWLRVSARPLFRQGAAGPHALVASFEDITQRIRLELELRRQALTDPLTGVPNRRALLDKLQQVFDLSRRTGMPASLLMLDIDNFKMVNDSYGHAVGDDVLKEVVECILATLRRTDYLARIGGDEFCILLPDTGEQSGAEMAARLEAAIERMVAQLVGVEPIRVGMSIGLASLASEDTGYSSWLKRGDDACYASKAERRARRAGILETL